MEPRRLALRGLNRFENEITVNFDDLPLGLIAVTGGNGSGKTTIMEGMGPVPLYLEFPSRPGSLRDRACRRDAYLELVQDYQGRTWRHLIQVDPGTGTSGARTEAFLWELGPGRELPAVGEATPEGTWIPVDGWPTPGRQEDYRRALEGLGFPAAPIFLAGPFAVHTGAGNFLELAPPERRELFVSLLGLAELQALADRAAAARKPLDSALGELQDLETELQADRATFARLTMEVATLEEDVARTGAAVTEIEARDREEVASLAALRSELGGLEDARRQAEARRLELQAELDRLVARASALEVEIAADQLLEENADAIRQAAARREELNGQRSVLVGERTGHLATRESAGRELHQARQELEGLIATRRRLEAEGQGLDVVVKELDRKRDELKRQGYPDETRRNLEEARQELAQATRAAVEAETAHREAQGRAPSLEAARGRLERLERDAQLLAGVPCKGGVGVEVLVRTWRTPKGLSPLPDDQRADCGACQFLVEARQAAGEIPAARDVLERAEEAGLELARLFAQAQERRAAVVELQARVERYVQAVTITERLETSIAGLQDRLARRPAIAQELEATMARSVELVDKVIPEIEARQVKAGTDVDAVDAKGRAIRLELDGLAEAPARLEALTVAVGRLPDRRQALQDTRQRHGETLASLQGLILPPEPTIARQLVRELEAEAERTAAQVAAARAAADGAREALGHARGRLTELGDLATRAALLEAGKASLARRRAGFREIERACGRTGIQVLEIDAAGPTVARICNDLLAATFGGRFAVRLDTMTEASQGRKARETFDLTVLDGNRAGRPAAPVQDLSKGERVLVDEALKLAISIFHAQRAGAQVLTLWRDECDGGLDVETRRRYPEMLRRAVEIGGFRRLYFVSHDPDVQAQADATIRVDKASGSVTMEIA